MAHLVFLAKRGMLRRYIDQTSFSRAGGALAEWMRARMGATRVREWDCNPCESGSDRCVQVGMPCKSC
jgi:hypothetical protein